MGKQNKLKQQKNETVQKGTSPGHSAKLFFLILSCFFISGFTGLIYETLWTRMIVKITGAAPFAVSIVLTVFMGGLGVGSYLASRKIDQINSPMKLIRLYGILESIIGAYGIVLPLLLVAFGPVYSILYNHLFNYFLTYNFLTFIGCSLLLIIPVICMGATLPVLSRFFVTSLSHVGTHVGRLYGLNTIGAAVGSLLCGFWLINVWGVYGTLFFAIFLNAIIGIICIVVSYKKSNAAITQQPTDSTTDSEQIKTQIVAENHSNMTHALIIFAVSGFCAMAYEVIWIKLLGLIVGPTTYSFTIVLVTFITCLALGSIFFGWLGDRVKNVMLLLLMTQVLAAFFALLFSQVIGNSQIFFSRLIFYFKDDFAQLNLMKAFVLFLLMFPPTFFLGATFPLVGKITVKSLSHTGKSIGVAYAINSCGAVLGSFFAGFLLVPFIGKENSVRLVVALQIFTALVIACSLIWKNKQAVRKFIPLLLTACIGLGLLYNYPSWDRKMLSRGKYHRIDSSQIKNTGWMESLFFGAKQVAAVKGEELVYFGDGIGGFTTVLKEPADFFGNRDYVLLNSGMADASSGGDMSTQTLSAHFPMLFHPHARKVLVIGLASGVTAGEVLNYPVDQLDIMEINEKVVAASNFFKPWNNNVLSNPKTKLIIQDGRAHLQLSKIKYDVIISEPSNPWMAGLAPLFTKEFFELGKSRLNDDGIFAQWIQAYETNWDTFAMVGRTFCQVFPNNILVNTDPFGKGNDYLIIGFKGEKNLNTDIAASNLPYAQKSKNTTILNHKLFYNLVVSEDAEKLFGNGLINTDSRPWLEFSAPKLLYSNDATIQINLMSNRWLNEKTKMIVQKNLSDIDTQIDFAAYAFSFGGWDGGFEHPIDFSHATPEQKKRFLKLVETYCAKNVVTRFNITDIDLRRKCLAIQEAAIRRKVGGLKEKQVPLNEYLGRLYLQSGEADEGIHFFNKVLQINPNHVDALNALGVALLKQGKGDEGIKYFYKVLLINPDHVSANNNLGLCLSKKGKFDEAIQYYNKALKTDPNDAETHNNFGYTLVSQGKLDEAIKHFSEAVRLVPVYVQALNNLGNAFLEQGKLDQALDQYTQVEALYPQNLETRLTLASIWNKKKRFDKAISYYSKALSINPDSIEALNNFAWILSTQNNSVFRDGPKAVNLAQRACKITGYKEPAFLDTLAAAYAEAGRFHEAQTTAQQALKLFESSGKETLVKDIKGRLQLYNAGQAFREGS